MDGLLAAEAERRLRALGRALRRFLTKPTAPSTIVYPHIADCGYPLLQARFQCEERFGHKWGRWVYHRLFAFRERECKRCDAVESQALREGEERV